MIFRSVIFANHEDFLNLVLTKMHMYKILLICMFWLASSSSDSYTENVTSNNGCAYAIKTYGSNNSLAFD